MIYLRDGEWVQWIDRLGGYCTGLLLTTTCLTPILPSKNKNKVITFLWGPAFCSQMEVPRMCEQTLVPSMWLTQVHTNISHPASMAMCHIHLFLCCLCVFYSRIPDSPFFLSSFYKFCSSADPTSRSLYFACQRQRSLLSVVACWDNCVTDAMWVAAVRVKNSGVLI